MKRFLLTILPVVLASVVSLAQKKSDRESEGIESSARTLRVEGRQLHAVTYKQWGVMVYTRIFDDRGRLLEDAEYLPGSNPDIKSTSAYDQRGNEIEHAYYIHDELNHRSTTRYDNMNREIEKVYFDSNGKVTDRLIFRYDRLGKQIALKVLPGGKTRLRSVVTFNNGGNELERIEYDERGALEHRYIYTYDKAGNRTSETDYYRQEGNARSSRNTYVYNDRGDLIEEALYFDGALRHKKTYKRDERGNQIESVETDGKGHLKEKRTWSYEFDSEGNWTRGVISEWNEQAPNEPIQPTYEYKRIFGSANDATIALWSAAREGDVARVAALLRRGADVNAHHPDGGTALIRAAKGQQGVVQLLLGSGTQVDAKDAEGWTALMWSAERGRIEIVKLLLSSHANPNAKNEVRGTAIMPAAINGHIDVLNLLLEKGAEVNAAADDGSTALMVAAQEGQTEAVKFLLAKGADPRMKTTTGLTALFFAADSNQETVSVLLETGLDINSRANDGSTPLMVAAEQSKMDVLRFLIEKGADVNARTNDGRTALSIAIKAKRTEAAELLRKAGAN